MSEVRGDVMLSNFTSGPTSSCLTSRGWVIRLGTNERYSLVIVQGSLSNRMKFLLVGKLFLMLRCMSDNLPWTVSDSVVQEEPVVTWRSVLVLRTIGDSVSNLNSSYALGFVGGL